MKIEVLRCDGSSEILNLVGPLDSREPREENGEIVGQGVIKCPATSMEYFFHADGRYDGWAMAVNWQIPIEQMPADGSLPDDALKFIQAIEDDREIEERPNGSE